MTNSKSFYSAWGFRIVCLAVFLLPIVLIGSWQAMRSNTNDVREWLPKEYEETQDYAWFQRHFGNEEFVVATWEGCRVDDDRLTLLADKIRPAKAIDKYGNEITVVRRVVTGKSLMDELTGPPLDLTPEEVRQRFRGTLFGPDGEQTCAVFTLTDDAKRDLKTTIGVIRRIATQECGISADELQLGGPPVVNQTIDVASARSLRQLAALSGIVGLLIAWWCFRTIKLTVLVVFAGVYSAMCSMAVVAFSGQVMNAILMTMAPLVYVAATSGAIHLANYYREAVLEKGSLGAAGRAIRHAWLPLSLATSTTAVGLLSLWYSELLPIKLFGLFSAIGVVISLFALFLVLPSVLDLWPARPQGAAAIHDEQETGEAPLPVFWQKFAGMVTAHYGKVSLVCFGVLALCILGLPRIETSIKIMRFFSPSTPIIHTYRWIESHLGGLVPMEVIIRIDDKDCPLSFLQRLELVQRVQEDIEQLEHVGSSISVVNFAVELPKRSDWPADPGWSRVRSTTNSRLERRLERLEDTGYLASGDGEQLFRISVRVGALNDIDYGEFIHRIEHIVKPVLARQLAQKIVSSETGETVQVQGVAATYTGMVPVMYKAQRSLLNGMLFGFSTDLALVVVAIIVLMRHWSSGLLLCLTSIFPATVIFGLMGWENIIVDIGTVMTPSVALGVTIDDVVHFLLWFRRGIERGLDRRNSVLLAYQGCARAMYQSWGVIGLGLSMFALSSFTPTMRFGALMVALLTAGLVGNLFFLPALLTGPLGGIIASSIRRRMARRQERAAAVSSRVPEPQPAEVFARGRRSVKT
jgi:predicted RND superfamily exporter protein